jgi:hypothetical protein
MGGKYIEQAGGSISEIVQNDYTVYAEGSIITNAKKGINEVGEDSGVSFGSPADAPPVKNKILKKFLINFKRPDDYKGTYGFDWLRDEYIYPIVTIANDNNNKPLNAPTPLCLDIIKLKQEYKKDVTNIISPYGKDYYPAWLSIFPHTTTAQFAHGSSMHKEGISLDIEVEEIESLISDDTIITFECSSPFVKISPKSLRLSQFVKSGKQTKALGAAKKKNYYLLRNTITVKCEGGVLAQHQDIKVFASLEKQKAEIGKLMIYKNNVIPKMELVMVNVITNPNSLNAIQNQRIKTYEFDFKEAGFNQALIRSEVVVYDSFDIGSLPPMDIDVANFKTNFIGKATVYSAAVQKEIVKLYNRYGKFKPNGDIDSNATKRTFLFFTEMNASGVRGITSCINGDIKTSFQWGNAYVIFKDGLTNRRAILHEAGHSMGLQHTFSDGDVSHGLKPPPHAFYHGYTDNIMDYTWQVVTNAANPYDAKDKMRSFFKWQWDILRNDRSLLLNY